jgi:hypothetical protein
VIELSYSSIAIPHCLAQPFDVVIDDFAAEIDK